MTKKLCFVGSGLKAGGQERHLTGLANYYSTIGFKVIIINLFQTECFFQIEKNILLFWPNVNRKNHSRLIYAVLILPYIRNILKNEKPDALLCFGEWFNPFVILATRFLKIPVFVFEMMGPNLYLGLLKDHLSNRVVFGYGHTTTAPLTTFAGCHHTMTARLTTFAGCPPVIHF